MHHIENQDTILYGFHFYNASTTYRIGNRHTVIVYTDNMYHLADQHAANICSKYDFLLFL